MMRILVIGSGGREHALVWKIAQSPKVAAIFCAPGNPGIEEFARCVPLKATDVPALLFFAEKEHIDLTVVGPEQPLAEGIVDAFEQRGLAIFGSTRKAAELEWSKAFAKDFMRRHGIPTAAHRTFSIEQIAEAKSSLQRAMFPLVLKADGLAAGKGVVVCQTPQEALSSLDAMMEVKVFGRAGEKVVVEEFLQGQEASVFAICDGKDFVTLAPAQDHKRVFDGDGGKNTGGMGAYAPAPIVTDAVLRKVEETIVRPTLTGMAGEGRPYKGCLYVGLMLTKEGPKVVEYNCRFGDPETQVVLPLLAGDLVELMLAASAGRIALLHKNWIGGGSAVCVVIASGGYPDSYETGFVIEGIDNVKQMSDVVLYHSGTKRERGTVVTAGGRVVGATAIVQTGTLETAIHRAYEAVGKLSFSGMHFRHDIGRKGLQL